MNELRVIIWENLQNWKIKIFKRSPWLLIQVFNVLYEANKKTPNGF